MSASNLATILPFAIEKGDKPINALVIEDSLTDQVIINKILSEDGYSVRTALNGNDAIIKFNEIEPDIIFMDLKLPDIDGYELTRILKGLSIDKYIPVIFVTGTRDNESLEKCLDSGGDDFVVKPIKENLLKAKAGSLLRVKKMHDELFVEKENISRHHDAHLKDLYDAVSVINNIHEPRFYNSGNLNWQYEAQNILSGDIICSAMNPSGEQFFLIGDNTGHGLPAAIGSIITCEIFYAMVSKGLSLQLIVEKINQKLYCILPKDRFLAASIIQINTEYSIMNIWNAALPSVIVTNSSGEIKETLPSIHLPLGIVLFDESSVVPIRVPLEQNDRIYALTDGLIEVFNKDNEIFGEQRFIESIECNSSLDKRVEAIIDDVKIFKGDVPTTDDVLLLEINCDKNHINKIKKDESHFFDKNPMEWEVSFNFSNEVICQSNPVPTVIQTMVDIQGFGQEREKIFLILTEMYSNSLEHSLLDLNSSIKEEDDGFVKYYELRQLRLNELKSGNIAINVRHTVEGVNGVVTISLEDNGNGFNYAKVMEKPADTTIKSGRGISLLRKLCRKCEFSHGGRKLDIEYEWQPENSLRVA